DAAMGGWNGQPGFGAERSLILLPDLVVAVDDDVGHRVRVPRPDRELAQDRAALDGVDGIKERRQDLVFDSDSLKSGSGLLGMFGGHDRDRLAGVPDLVAGGDQDRLVGGLV